MKILSLPSLVSLAAALSLAALPACHKPSEPSGPAPTRADAELRALALARPTGKGPVEDAILKLEERLDKSAGENADWWATLAQEWVIKARRSQDPGYYLSADAAAQLALQEEPNHRLASA